MNDSTTILYHCFRTLEDVLARASHAPVAPTWATRLALLIIRSTGAGLPWHFREFEKHMADPHMWSNDGGEYMRSLRLTGLLHHWYRDLGLEEPDCVQRGKWQRQCAPLIDDNPLDLPFDSERYERQHGTMCNLKRLERPASEVAALFRAINNAGNTSSGDVYPQYPGMVIRETDQGRELTGMIWGFPLHQKGKQGQALKPRPVNNARTDKLLSPFWKGAATNTGQRCLIPITAFAEAVGPKGKMTRTWLTVPEQDIFVCAGIWRASPEWGNVYSMVMTDARADLLHVHDRMPVILDADQYDAWLHQPIEDAIKLCVPYREKMSEHATSELWARPRSTGSTTSVFSG